MKCTKVFGYVLLALLFISTVPYAAEAGVVKIRPHQFKVCNPSDTHNFQSAWAVEGSGGEAEYYAVVKLPVGKRVTKLVLLYSSNSATSGTDCFLERLGWGIGAPLDQMARAGAFGDTSGNVYAVSDTAIGYAKVKAGFTYQVYLDVGDGVRVHGVKVQYH